MRPEGQTGSFLLVLALSQMKIKNLVAGAIEGLLVGVLEGEGSGGAILPRLGAKVVVEAGASGHGLGVEVGGEGAVLHRTEAHEKLRCTHGNGCHLKCRCPTPSSTEAQRPTPTSTSAHEKSIHFPGRIHHA